MWNAVRNNERVRSTVKGTKRTCLRRTPSLSVVPLLLGDSDSLSVSYGMEPEQERLFKLYSGSGIHSLPELNPNTLTLKSTQMHLLPN